MVLAAAMSVAILSSVRSVSDGFIGEFPLIVNVDRIMLDKSLNTVHR